MTAAPPIGSGLRRGSADANILVHLQRSKCIDLLDMLFERVYVEKFVRGEVARSAPDVTSALFGEAEVRVSSCLCTIEAASALSVPQRKLYDTPPRVACPRDLLEFLADVSREPWFAAWRAVFGVSADKVPAIARELADLDQ